MRRIIIASHHKLAYGMANTIKFLSGYENLYDLSAYVDDDVVIEDQIKAIMNEIKEEDEVFIFTDILGGSVTQKFFPYMKDTVHLITGMNLPLIMGICFSQDSILSKDEINKIIEEAKNQIIYVNESSESKDYEDE